MEKHYSKTKEKIDNILRRARFSNEKDIHSHFYYLSNGEEKDTLKEINEILSESSLSKEILRYEDSFREVKIFGRRLEMYSIFWEEEKGNFLFSILFDLKNKEEF